MKGCETAQVETGVRCCLRLGHHGWMAVRGQRGSFGERSETDDVHHRGATREADPRKQQEDGGDAGSQRAASSGLAANRK